MKTNVSVTLVVVCASLIALTTYYLVRPLPWNIDLNPFLVDKKSGAIIEPLEFVDLAKVIKLKDSYLNATSPIEKLFDLVQQENYEVFFHPNHYYANEQDSLSSSWPPANQTKCTQDIQSILAYLEENSDYRSSRGSQYHQIAKYLDSFGRPSSQLFTGSIRQVGSYEECLASRLHVKSEQDAIKMRYCWSRWTFKSWPQEFELLRPKSYISFGTCLPQSCDSSSANSTINANQHALMVKLITHQWSSYYRENMQLHELYCLPDEQSPLRQLSPMSYVYLALVSCWLLALILASIVLTKKRNGDRNNEMPMKQTGLMDGKSTTNEETDLIVDHKQTIWYNLAMGRALKKFASNNLASHRENRVNLAYFNLIKSFAYYGVIVGHSVFVAHNYTINIEAYYSKVQSWVGPLMLALPRLIDTFFVMFGILASYNLVQPMIVDGDAKNKRIPFWKLWLLFIIKTFIRIVPLYLLTLGFVYYIEPYMSSGPWWDYGTSHLRSRQASCWNQPWYNHLLLSTLISGSPDMCLPQSWFISCYLIWSLFCPPLIWLLVKLPNDKSRMGFVGFISLVPSVRFCKNMIVQRTLRVDAFTWYGPYLMYLVSRYQTIGVYDNIESLGYVSIGCFVGLLLYKYNIGLIDKWPSWLATSGRGSLWFSVLANLIIFCASFVGALVSSITNEAQTLTQILVGSSVLRFLWPMANCFLFVLLATEHKHSSFARFASHSFWHVFNKLGLCIYMVHWELIVLYLTLHDHSPSQGFYSDIFRISSFAYLMSGILSFFIHILFEIPISDLLMYTVKKIFAIKQ